MGCQLRSHTTIFQPISDSPLSLESAVGSRPNASGASGLALACCLLAVWPALAQDVADLSDARMELMRKSAFAIRFDGKEIPESLESKPLFRYDDLARGYQDGAVWRLGAKGRPLAIVTTELHPRYGRQRTNESNPRVVYDLLSLTEKSFRASSRHLTWRPSKSAVEMETLSAAPKPAKSKGVRLIQLKEMARRFQANQLVNETGTENQKLVLRLLPKPIDRYRPTDSARADAAVFLYVAGRMPGVILFIETDGESWRYGVGRLSGPSKLSVLLDKNEVWLVEPDTGTSSEPYFATNGTAQLPGE